jgi:hypothetical protein
MRYCAATLEVCIAVELECVAGAEGPSFVMVMYCRQDQVKVQ